jgi:maltodextrin utilization protein YvdJ
MSLNERLSNCHSCKWIPVKFVSNQKFTYMQQSVFNFFLSALFPKNPIESINIDQSTFPLEVL